VFKDPPTSREGRKLCIARHKAEKETTPNETKISIGTGHTRFCPPSPNQGTFLANAHQVCRSGVAGYPCLANNTRASPFRRNDENQAAQQQLKRGWRPLHFSLTPTTQRQRVSVVVTRQVGDRRGSFRGKHRAMRRAVRKHEKTSSPLPSRDIAFMGGEREKERGGGDNPTSTAASFRLSALENHRPDFSQHTQRDLGGWVP